MVEDSTEKKESTGDDKDVKDDTSTDESLDLDKVTDESLKDLDEDTQKKIKGFQADYTKKTQALAEERKEIDRLKTRAARADELEHFLDTDPLVKEFNEFKAKKEKGESDSIDDDDDEALTDPDVKKLKKSVAQTQKEMNELTRATQVSNKMLVDLMSEIQSKRFRNLTFEISPQKVLNYARENNLVDMKRAIDGCYADDIKESEFAKRLEQEKEKWVEKEKTTVLTSTMPLGRQVRKVIARKRGSTE
jgi:hypothetical protein